MDLKPKDINIPCTSTKGLISMVIAPGRKEGQSSPDFELEMTEISYGQVSVTVQKESSNWGAYPPHRMKLLN
ncbi:hypothetical protein D5R40_33030 [Okeania hirsuta]|uniref:Uncharacterized protein n=1 Tax=Okeania hirsuta TaxID=1458930 RepID=A0A3N6QR74_9CYAN|nr:hypothetical protein D5R40_33030 [Okeania hirsuta]